MNCEQYLSDLFEFAEGGLSAKRREEIDRHLADCENCSSQLQDIWQMRMIASRWRDRPVPAWQPRRLFFAGAWLPRLQLAGSFASILVLLLVLSGFRISTKDGIEFGFSRDYVDTSELRHQLDAIQDTQQARFEARLRDVSARQMAANERLLTTILENNREQRRQELSSALMLLDRKEDQRARLTRESIGYLLTSQIEDKRNIERLNKALLQVGEQKNQF